MKVWMALIVLVLTCPVAALAAPALQVDEPVWNVGKVVAGVEQNRSFVIENVGDETLVIEQVEQCCGFFGSVEKSQLLPGERTALRVRLKPVKMVGDLLAEIFLVSNDPRQPRYPVTAVGSVLPTRHALGELVQLEDFLDLGVMLPGEPISFSIRVKNVGNEPLRITRVEKGKGVFETGSRMVVPPGEEGDLTFRYVAERFGPIDEKVTLVTNDALDRTLPVQLKGYVARDWIPDRAVVIYPIGLPARYDSALRGYRYEVMVENRSGLPIEVVSLESSMPATQSRAGGVLEPRQKGSSEVTYPLTILHDGPVAGRVNLNISLPLEIR